MTRIIKKYPNRRLYDTECGRYITLEEIKQFVFEHTDFQVVDTQTQKDLTQTTLLQIIMEQETTHTPIFTTAVLQDFIRFYQKKTQNLLSEYLEQTFHLMTQQKNFLTQQWQTYQDYLLHPPSSKTKTKKTTQSRKHKKTAKKPTP